MNERRMQTTIRALTGILPIAMAAGACSAPTGARESTGHTSEALELPVPVGSCTFVDGHQGTLPTALVAPSSHAEYPGGDNVVQAFLEQAQGAGGSGSWWALSQPINGFPSVSWLAEDVSTLSLSGIGNL